MTHVELKAIKQRIDMAKNCHGETFDADINGEDPRQNVDIIRDQDRSALYLEVLRLQFHTSRLRESLDLAHEALERMDTEFVALSAKLEEAQAQRDALRADIRTLESLYNRDGMAQMLASQIEKIFDRVLHGDTDIISEASPGAIVKAQSDARTPEWRETSGNISTSRMDAKRQADLAPDGCWWCRVLPGELHLQACDRTMRAVEHGEILKASESGKCSCWIGRGDAGGPSVERITCVVHGDE